MLKGTYVIMNISDELLLSSYYEAIQRNLDNHFIELLKNEIDSRSLDINEYFKFSFMSDDV